MSEYWVGFASGVGAVLIGFILTMAWDLFKWNRELKKREETVLSAVKEELQNNLDLSKHIYRYLQEEFKVIDTNKTIVEALPILYVGFWDLIIINLPKKLLKTDVLIKIRNVSQFTNIINEQIRSRENYRINNEAMSNYHSRIKLYDQILMGHVVKLSRLLEELEPFL